MAVHDRDMFDDLALYDFEDPRSPRSRPPVMVPRPSSVRVAQVLLSLQGVVLLLLGVMRIASGRRGGLVSAAVMVLLAVAMFVGARKAGVPRSPGRWIAVGLEALVLLAALPLVMQGRIVGVMVASVAGSVLGLLLLTDSGRSFARAGGTS